jgi:hypothetical protein
LPLLLPLLLQVGRPTWFVSHRWGGSFRGMVDALREALRDAVAANVSVC